MEIAGYVRKDEDTLFSTRFRKCKSNFSIPKKNLKPEGTQNDFTTPNGKLNSLTPDEKK